ncbi:RICIN domain-containing protein, partial [Streptomyces arboris]|uniref:RICIN domain-containing protein n=1 Tax=Streptomyces arboris TaxID=2600619 RepID=UPI003631C953
MAEMNTARLVLELPGPAGSRAHGGKEAGSVNQAFTLEPLPTEGSDVYRIINTYNGLALDMTPTGVVTARVVNVNTYQYFRIIKQGDGSEVIRHAYHDLVLNMTDDGIVSGRRYDGNRDQSFRISHNGANSGISSWYHQVAPPSVPVITSPAEGAGTGARPTI